MLNELLEAGRNVAFVFAQNVMILILGAMNNNYMSSVADPGFS